MLITGKLPINCDVLSGWMCEVCMVKDRRPITCFGNQKLLFAWNTSADRLFIFFVGHGEEKKQ